MTKRINSRRKGAGGERAAAQFLCSLGFAAERSARNGVKGAGDLIVRDLPNVHIEVKRLERMDIGTVCLADACDQARAASGLGRRWAVLWRPNGKSWRLTFRAHAPAMNVTVEEAAIPAALWWLNSKG